MHLGHPREGSETAPCPGPEGKRGRAEGSINIGRDGHCGSGTAHDLESAERSHARRQGGRSCPSSGVRMWGRAWKRELISSANGEDGPREAAAVPKATRLEGGAPLGHTHGTRWPGPGLGASPAAPHAPPLTAEATGPPEARPPVPGSAAVIGRPGAVTWTRRPAGSGLRQRGPLRSCTRSLLPV